VDRAIAQAKKLPAVKRMLAGVKAPKAAGGGGGPKAVRSAYMVRGGWALLTGAHGASAVLELPKYHSMAF
jgi:hypothetical protein